MLAPPQRKMQLVPTSFREIFSEINAPLSEVRNGCGVT